VGTPGMADGTSDAVGPQSRSARLARTRRFVARRLLLFGATRDRHQRALFTGVSRILGARRANAEDTDRGLMTTMGGAVAVIGLVLLIWPGTGVVAISWIIALGALLLAALLIFLALRLKRLKKRVDNLAPLRSAE